MIDIKQINSTWIDYPSDKTFNALFEEQVAKSPTNVAVSYNNESLTFVELDQRSNQLANYLLSIYFKTNNTPLPVNSLILICMDRSLEMLIAMVAVMKAGAAYVPLDPSYPELRIKSILEDTKSPIILTKEAVNKNKLCSNVPNFTLIQLDNKDIRQSVNLESSEVVANRCSSSELAYVIFTSGTTGNPKGVMITHRSLINRLTWMKRTYLFTDKDKILQKTPFTFDVSVWELLLPLLTGGQVVMAVPDGHKDPRYLLNTIKSQQISRIHFVPSMLQVFLNNMDDKLADLQSLKSVFCSGEKLSPQLANLFKMSFPAITLNNLYGPTETTIDVTNYDNISGYESVIPIGRPIANTTIYITDEYLNLLPVGVIGELYIGGDGVALGYLNQPALTKQRFLENPFVSKDDVSKQRNLKIYKTGDLVKWLPNGSIEYIGRNDFQVKINGLRIELEEIEHHLLQHPVIKQVVIDVCDGDEPQDKKLVAYFVPKLDLTYSKTGESSANLLWAWNKIYESIYEVNPGNLDTNSDLIGWNSSYTKAPISTEEMQEWVTETIKRISQLKKDTILEIGCGTGLLMQQLLEQCSYYTASDFSQNVISKLNGQIKNKTNIQFICCPADTIASQVFHQPNPDLIILNSIIQCFPNLDYLKNVINQSIDLITMEGCIFLGDVRDYRLMEIFHASVQKYQQPGQENDAIKQMAQFFSVREKELLVAPDFFLNFKQINNKIIHVDILPKSGEYSNEMNNYRYDVILHVSNDHVQRLTVNHKIQVYDTVVSKFSLINLLKNNCDFIINKYPRKNIISDINFYRSLNGNIINNNNKFNDIFSSKELFELGKDYGYQIKMMINPDKSSFSYYTLVFSRNKDNQLLTTSEIFNVISCSEEQFSNNPTINNLISPEELKNYLEKFLPNYMVPTYFIPLSLFPLTESGKIDKNSLPIPKLFLQSKELVELPTNKLEQQLCKIWQDILKLEKIGINDNFFVIGGNSLSAIIMCHEIAVQLQISISVNNLFTYSTVKQLCKYLQSSANLEVIHDSALYSVQPDLENQYEPFPLTVAQQDYVKEKSLLKSRGIHTAHRYVEFLFDFIDINHLEAAVNKLVQYQHSMRTILKDDMQIVLETFEYYLIVFNDISNLSKNEHDLKLENIRQELSQRDFDLTNYPLFDIRLTKCSEGVILHVCMDGFFRDGFSTGVLFQELINLYGNPSVELPPLKIQFRDYVMGLVSLNNSTMYQRDKEYWLQFLPKLSFSPQLPLKTDPQKINSLNYINDTRILSSGVWEAIEEKALSCQVAPTSVILCIFGIALSRFCKEDHFLIGLTLFNRLPFHHQVNQIIGNFATRELVDFKLTANLSFKELVIQTHSELWEGLSHGLFTGLEIQHELKQVRGLNEEDNVIPIVFTSGLSISSAATGNIFNQIYKGRGYQQRHNSRVWFSNQVYEKDGDLFSVWDYMNELYDEEMMKSMHDQYCELIQHFAIHDWGKKI